MNKINFTNVHKACKAFQEETGIKSTIELRTSDGQMKIYFQDGSMMSNIGDVNEGQLSRFIGDYMIVEEFDLITV